MDAMPRSISGFWRLSLPYLTLSAVSGMVELGLPLAAIHSGLPLDGVLLVGLGYQAGGFVRYLPSRSTGPIVALALLAAVCSLVAPHEPWLLPLVAAALAAVVQALREATKSDMVATSLKRSARIGGFLLSPLFTIYPLIAVASVAMILASLHTCAAPPRPFASHSFRPHLALKLNMLVHQAHYFCYAYPLIYLVADTHAKTRLVALVFAAGWISYTAAPMATRRMPPVAAFIAGHILVALMLSSIAMVQSDVKVVVIAWILTGFGGGTVYVLRRFAVADGLPDGEMDAWEDIGHVVGVLIALGIAVLMRSESDEFWTAAVLALVAAVLMARITGRAQGNRTGNVR